MLPRVYHSYLFWEGCNQTARSRYNTRLAQLLLRLIYSPCVVDWNVLNQMGCGETIDEMMIIMLCVDGTNEEIFTSVAWTNAFNIDEQIYSKLCHEFYSTYEFDKVCAADELKTKKIIIFRLCGRAFSWTLLEFAKRLGLCNSEEIEEEGFDVYFQGGVLSDEHFNAQEYWLSISREENLSLSRSHVSTIRNPVLRVLHKMITYGLCQRTIGYDKIQKNDLWLLSMFDARHQNRYANVAWLIARWMKRKGAGSQKESMICSLDTTTLRELINSKDRLIPEALEPGVMIVSIPRPPRASMQDLYAGVFEHMAGVYNVSQQGAYNPLGYDQQQYDQYYQQYHLSSSSNSHRMMSSIEMTRLFDPNSEICGGNGGRGGSMAGRGGGWLAKRSIVSNEGCGGGRLAVCGGRSLSESKKG
ncbi:hypothetical protein Tco_0286617 [Tanacetum coccineum]